MGDQSTQGREGSICKMEKRALLCLIVCLGLALAAPQQDSRQEKKNVQRPATTGGGPSRRLLALGVTSISPTYGPMEGNSLVMVVGTFTASDVPATALKECKFGTSKTTATRINDTHVSCRTPKHSTGSAVFKLVITPAGGSPAEQPANANTKFTFFPTMFVSDFKTSSVLRYNADTGAFFDVFVQPRSGGLDGPWGTAFGLDHKIYRYNGYTGSPRGVYIEGGGLDHPWGLIFDKFTNDTYVTSEYKDHILRYKQPTWGLYGGYGVPSTNGGIHVTGSYDPAAQTTNPQGMGISNGLGEEITHNAQQLKLGVNVWKGRFDKVWTNTRVNYANGLDFTVDSLYVTGPYCGNCIVRFNRTTGEYMHHFEDEYLNYPVDIKEFRDYLYVCSEDQVRKYNRLNGEFIKTHSQTDGLLGSFLLFHINWNQNLGE